MPGCIVPGVVDCLSVVLLLPLYHDEVLLYFSLEVAGDVAFLIIVGLIEVLLEKHSAYILPIVISCFFLLLDFIIVAGLGFDLLLGKVCALLNVHGYNFG